MDEIELTPEQIIERDRVLALQARFDALPQYRLCMFLAGYNVLKDKKWRKSEYYKNKCIQENDLSYIEALEAVAPTVQAQLDEEENKRLAAIELKKKLKDFKTKDKTKVKLEELVEIVQDLIG